MKLHVEEFQPVRQKLIRPRKTVLYGKGQLLSPEGDVLWEDADWMPNFLTDEGEQSLLNVFYREQSNPTKFLALLNMASPVETTTMASMTESKSPGADGYARQQILGSDWSSPALNSGDYQVVAAEKSFGPISGSTMTATHAAVVTTSTGTGGLLLQVIALSASTPVAVGQSFRYTLTNKAQ